MTETHTQKTPTTPKTHTVKSEYFKKQFEGKKQINEQREKEGEGDDTEPLDL